MTRGFLRDLKALARDERGLTVLEAAVIGVLVVIAIFGGMTLMSRYDGMRSQRDAARLQVAQLSAQIASQAQVVQQSQQQPDASAAKDDVRAAVPGMEAYNADHSTGYTGVTATKLQQSYDAGITNVTIVRATSTSYCVQSDTGEPLVYHKGGPAGDIVSGSC